MMKKMRESCYHIFFLLFIITMPVLFSACADSETIILQAAREGVYPILLPHGELKGWMMDESVYEDELLAIRYIKGENEQISLIHDMEIQGLNVFALRNYIMSQGQSTDEKFGNILEINGFVGEMYIYEEPFPTIQFTFVRKQNLLGSIDQIPMYQVIAKNTTLEEFLTFMKALKVTYS